ncbi:hypothetical protein BLS_009778 [Venturia inaequalis]|uniref:AMP-dependent synthetase/ligase domain-containing protein n=1 Tax=Venturia inaequalis TaxID=5025 RepID=A0A8H3UZN7_VENIN|nr:hypothetical protein BLS_009778 [Venturia inaequalis]
MVAVTPKALVAASSALIAGATYIDAQLAITRDVQQIFRDKRYGKAIGNRFQALRNNASAYGHLLLADPSAEALWFEGRTWTWGQVKKETDALAEILLQHGAHANTFIAVFMTNSPEMVFAILAISKLGAVPALVNTALRNQTLLHCMGLADAHMVITTPDLTEHLIPLTGEPKMANLCVTLDFGSYASFRASASSTQPDHFIQVGEADLQSVTVDTPAAARTAKDIAALIYTSGTSGKPKAVSVKNDRFAIVSVPAQQDADNPRKYFPMRVFSCLPLFHATALYTGLFQAMGTSGTFCLARKFSASGFSRSLAECQATRVLYVGELARYLLKAPPSPYDKAHPCRVASGNGLQKDVWLKFMERFGITEIREFYRSTEGLAKFDNFSHGAIAAGKLGFQGPIANYMTTDTILVRYDTSTEAPWRDPKTGFCARAKKGEPGEAIGLVTGMDFYPEYLNNPEANDKKLITDVFKRGDVYQRTGDLLVRERSGWIRFHDRSGDTYRWNGENVSAGEVRELISSLPGVQDVTVYGVKLDGYDGQAGAAAITLADPSPHSEKLFVDQMFTRLKATGLTTFQVPRLVRFSEQIEVGATFKHLKTQMQTRSWNPKKQTGKDSVYWLDGESYRRLDAKSWAAIQHGKARL